LIVQLLVAARVAGRLPHVVLAIVNWLTFAGVPVRAMPVMLSVAVPLLVSVTVCAEVVVVTTVGPNGTLVGESKTAGAAAAVPVPVMVTACGLFAALLVNVSEAEAPAAAVGLKVTDRTQLLPAPRLLPQGLVRANWLAFAPVSAMLVMLSAASPVFLSVTVCAELVVPTVWFPKLRVVGFRETAGAAGVPVPVTGILCGLPLALSATLSEALIELTPVGAKVTEMVQLPEAATEAPQLLV